MVNTVCRSVEFGLRAIGVWPDTSYAILRRAFCISTMAIFQTFQYQHLIMHYGDEDLFLLMDVLSATLAYTLLLIKLIIFSFNARLLNEIIARLVEDWKERDVCDEYAMTRMSYISRRFSNFIIALYALSVLLYATGTLLRYKSNNQNDTRELILKMELPFEIKSTSVHVAVLVTQFIHQTSAASMVGVMNSLLITLVLHVCGQIDTVRQKLSEITRKDIKRDASESIVKMLIIRHQKIISFSKNIEAFFSNIALIQFVSNTLVICCLGFIIVIHGGIYILFPRRVSQYKKPEDRRCGVRIALVRAKPKSKSRCPDHDHKVTEAPDAHNREGHGSFSPAIRQHRESFGVIRVGVTRNVLKPHTARHLYLRVQKDIVLLSPPVVYTINNFSIQRGGVSLQLYVCRQAWVTKHRFTEIDVFYRV
ncbi:PREDICTED: odorant receptor 13a-like isoform X2 [Vollenhovia emeryi]|uniref:odorant receptor 13a-like isoform X2 n=1 Tax=Vollenhovia emeryi TaxID=411798 RepID=UPI0005F47611|nr:PREDICTED: odorant receptor 13a-like isoform X2 [Vollenhovia emeryi]